jgi:hypothetical protein
MKRFVLGLLLSLLALAVPALPPDGMFASGEVAGVIDAWHAAAAAADEEKYFSHFTADAVFLGTDATERWTRDEFRKWAHPYFAKGKAWTYKSTSRWISFAADRSVAWFDELLENAHLGTCRGSGVLVRSGETWKIAQYNLSIPIPNDLADDLAKRIEAYQKGRKGK